MPATVRAGYSEMKASIIIPTFNRAGMLDACLRSLADQSLPSDEFEVIVIDNGSTDDTTQVLARHQSVLQLRWKHVPEPGLHAGRHEGMRLAFCDVLVFADDDIVASPSWVKTIVDAFSDPSVALVGGNNLPLFEGQPPNWLSRWWDSPAGRGRALSYLSILDFGAGMFDISPHYIWGCNFSVRRDVLHCAGGFHPDAFPNDRLRWRGDGETHVSEWVLQNGLRAVFNSGASVHHRVPLARMTPDYFAKRGYAQGISDSYSDIRHRVLHGRASHAMFPHRPILNWMRQIKTNWTRAPDQVEQELRDVKLAVLRGWRAGYRFHQRSVSEDADLLAWVTKATYL